ncbi:MAG: rod shape-determining protein MreC [Gammaproteobacteria bacterium]
MPALKYSRPKPLFYRGPSLLTRFVLWTVLSVALMVLDHQRGALDAIRSVLTVVVYPIRLAVDLPFRVADWTIESLTTRAALLDENRTLKREQIENRVRLQRLAAVEAENARLRALLDSSAQLPDRVRIVGILAVDLDPNRQQIVIDKGTRDGVYDGQALVDAFGVVGQTVNSGPLDAEAILITDSDHALPVQVLRNGTRTIAFGTGLPKELSLPFLPNNADILEGDLLVTSGLGGRFPAGYPVATITKIERSQEQPYANVRAEPAAALERVREVLLIWPDTESLSAEDGDEP